MASAKTMSSTNIELSLLNIPITIGKAWSESREQSFVKVCDHSSASGDIVKIDQSERCERCGGAPSNKQRALDLGDGKFRIISENEFAGIEAATKTPTLKVLDVQPMSKLPIMYSTGTYYVRHDDKSKVGPRAFAVLADSLSKNRMGLVCKWGNSSRQKLCVLSVESGVMIMRVIPFLSDIRVASKKEREHFKVKVEDAEVEKMSRLLNEIRNEDGFQYQNYEDEGLKLREAAVERILAGEEPEQIEAPDVGGQLDDVMALIDNAVSTETRKKTHA